MGARWPEPNPECSTETDRCAPRPRGRGGIPLRHAKSDWSGDAADIERPLADRGWRQAPDAGRWLAANIGSISLAVVSPAARATSTWKVVAAEVDVPPQ